MSDQKNTLNYKPRCRGNPDNPEMEEIENGLRFKRECFCCLKFSSTIKQYKKEVGNCKILGVISEWGVCDSWELNKLWWKREMSEEKSELIQKEYARRKSEVIKKNHLSTQSMIVYERDIDRILSKELIEENIGLRIVIEKQNAELLELDKESKGFMIQIKGEEILKKKNEKLKDQLASVSKERDDLKKHCDHCREYKMEQSLKEAESP